ncbi:MAG TPA: PEP-CTERM sorting domain-containing protein [Alphaproteobacteria bacterium]|nr:PEP-CTERM sorting domain-containing protein [Alphaproteobacteria bacterium]
MKNVTRTLSAKHLAFAAALAAGTLLAGGAKATTFDTTLTSPPGVYWGTGNINAHFVTNIQDNIELGLGTIQRFIGPIAPDANTSVYHVQTGATTVPGKTGSDWGFVFSINTNVDGTGSLTLSDLTASLCIQDVGHGSNTCFNPLLIPDNAHFGSTGAQNSEALSFAGFDPGYDINANDTYLFTLDVTYGATAPRQLTVNMTDIAGTGAVPEPGTLALFGAGLAGLGWLRRRGKAHRAG